MDKTLQQINEEIKKLEQERNTEAMNRINALGVFWRIQEELNGNIFGITIPKNVQDYDNSQFDSICQVILDKINYLKTVYSNKDKYAEEYFNSITNGITEEKFNEYANQLISGIKSIKVSNSKLDGIFEKEINLGKEKAEKENQFDLYIKQIKELQEKINLEKENIALTEQYIAEKEAKGMLDETERKFLTGRVNLSKKSINAMEKEIETIQTKSNNEDLKNYITKLQEEERIKEEQRKQEEEQKKVDDFHKKVEEKRISQELDKAENAYYGVQEGKNTEEKEPEQQEPFANAKTPAELSEEQARKMTEPAKTRVGKAIKRAGEWFKGIINSKATKTVMSVALALTGLGFITGLAPGVVLTGTGALGYNEVKKGMGK